MSVNLQWLNDRMLLLTWYDTPPPGAPIYADVLDALRRTLDRAEGPICVVADLRFGCMGDEDALRKLAALSQHPNFGPSTAFGTAPLSTIVAATFARLAARDVATALWDTAAEALAYLQHHAPSFAAEVDLNALDALSPLVAV